MDNDWTGKKGIRDVKKKKRNGSLVAHRDKNVKT
jgi:hypothetical protein